MRSLLRKLLGGVLLSVFVAISAGAAADAGNAFEQANTLYSQEKYAEAAAAYESMIASGLASATVYYNLGNALFRAGQNGRAIAAYRKAQELTPRDPNLRFNLEFVRKKVSGFESAPRPMLQRFLRDLTVNEWTALAACAYWVWLLVMALREFKPGTRKALRGYTMTAGIITFILASCLCAAIYERSRRVEAVVVVSNAVMRESPVVTAKVTYQSPDGCELQVLDQQVGTPPWLYVQDASGRRGWVASDQVVVLGKVPAKPREL